MQLLNYKKDLETCRYAEDALFKYYQRLEADSYAALKLAKTALCLPNEKDNMAKIIQHRTEVVVTTRFECNFCLVVEERKVICNQAEAEGLQPSLELPAGWQAISDTCHMCNACTKKFDKFQAKDWLKVLEEICSEMPNVSFVISGLKSKLKSLECGR